MTPAFRCGHPRAPENVRDVSKQYPHGRCKRCRMLARRKRNGVVTPRVALPDLPVVKRPRSDAGTIRAGTVTHFACGHERSLENVRLNGTPNGCCRACNNANAQRLRDDAKADRQPARIDSNDARVALYRTEKAKAEERRRSRVMDDAKAAFAAMLQREQDAGRGGRPRGSKNNGWTGLNPQRPQIHAVKCDPADALIVALGHYGGAA